MSLRLFAGSRLSTSEGSFSAPIVFPLYALEASRSAVTSIHWRPRAIESDIDDSLRRVRRRGGKVKGMYM